MASETARNSKTAKALNRWQREGLDFLGGADGAALQELFEEFYLPTSSGSASTPQEYDDENFAAFFQEDDDFRDDLAASENDCNPPLFEDAGDDLYDPFSQDAPLPAPHTPVSSLLATPSQQFLLSSSTSGSWPPSQQSVASGLDTDSHSPSVLSSELEFSSESVPLSQQSQDLQEPLPGPSQSPAPSTQSVSSSQESLPSLSSSTSQPRPPGSSQSVRDTVSTACRRSDLVQVRCERRPRKPSPPRHKHPTPDERLEAFLLKGCGCKWNSGDECYKLFDRDHYIRRRDECNSLTREWLDMVVLGQIMAFVSLAFYHAGKKICTSTFVALHSIGRGQFKALKAHFLANGLEERMHGNIKRLPYNTLTLGDSQNAMKFVRSYAETNAILLPGRIPGYKRDDLQLLPSSTTKKAIWLLYKAACDIADLRVVAYNTFCTLWRNTLPFVTVMKPMTDLCQVCQKNSIVLSRSSSTAEEERSEIVQHATEHLTKATKARSYMRGQVEMSRREMEKVFTGSDGVLHIPSIGSSPCPCSNTIKIHFSFDFARQVHYPHSPQQPGPIYFLTPRKCGIFGVNCEAIPRQVNYLIDEGMNIGKGANCIISLLNHFLETHNLGEAHLLLHTDNCCGQNKNRFVMQYLAWRVATGRNTCIEISFLLVGHTKFAPDWCFGLLKQKFRKASVGCLDDLLGVVNQSADVNYAQLVGKEDGTVLVHQYDWAGFFTSYFKRTALKPTTILSFLLSHQENAKSDYILTQMRRLFPFYQRTIKPGHLTLMQCHQK